MNKVARFSAVGGILMLVNGMLNLGRGGIGSFMIQAQIAVLTTEIGVDVEVIAKC